MMVTADRLRKLGKIDKILLSRINRLIYRGQHWRTHRPIQGLPEGITFDTVNKLCLDHLGEPLRRVSYVHLSGWKTSGAYRLFLRSVNGHTWRLIYKNAIYSQEQIPALIGLPISPGIPEYLVYKHSKGALSRYLPEVYLCSEIVPARQYQYLLEDMNQTHRVLVRKEYVLKAAAELPKLHQAMADWSLTIDREHLLRFDRNYSTALLKYARKNLEIYARETADRAIVEILELWPQISQLHGRDEFYDPQTIRPIHGDFNSRNIYFHRKNPGCIKLIDWEWAGLGKAHADLASLLKRATPEVERQALVAFSNQEPQLSFDEHRRVYEWCQLERGLLDAAFLARQQLESARKVDWIPKFIPRSISRVRDAYERLV